MAFISKTSGQGGKIEGAYIKSDAFDEMKKYAEDKINENQDPDRKPYSLIDNNCGTFAEECILQDKNVDKPNVVKNSPINIVDEYQEEGNAKVTYDPVKKVTIIGKGNESDAKKNYKQYGTRKQR